MNIILRKRTLIIKVDDINTLKNKTGEKLATSHNTGTGEQEVDFTGQDTGKQSKRGARQADDWRSLMR